MFEFLKDTNLTVNIELKTGVIYYKDIEKKTVALVHEMGYENRVLYSSFNHRSVLKVREFDPDAKMAFLYSHQLSGVSEYAKMNGVSAVNPSVLCTHLEDEMYDCLKNNIDIHVWTVNSEEEMHRLCKMGVSAIITNYPDVAKSICEEEKAGV